MCCWGAAIAVAIAGGATGSPAYGQSGEVTLTLGVEGNGQVAISPSGFPSVIACVSRCTKVVPPNTPVTIVADAPEGFIPVWGEACDGRDR